MNQDKSKKTILLSCAKTIFMEKGYSKTKVDEICQLAGVAKGTFFYYFETKKHIILEMIHKHIQEIRSEFCHNLIYATSSLEKLDLALDIIFCSKKSHVIDINCDEEQSISWMEKKLHEVKLEMLQPILYDIILEGKESGVFDVHNVDITCSVLLNGLNAFYTNKQTSFSDPKLCKVIYKGIDEIINKMLSIDVALVS